MPRPRRIWAVSPLVVLALALLVSACEGEEETTTTSTAAKTETTAAAVESVTLYVGGTFALTGPYSEDCAAVLAGFQDYVEYVNDNHILAPWYEDKTIPEDITFELKWGDTALAPDKTITIYEDLKEQGLLVQRVSDSSEGMALKDILIADQVGATSQSTSPAYLSPDGCIFTNAPIYTDEMAAIAEWYMEKWTGTEKPRVAYLTAHSTLGRNIDIPEMEDALEDMGYDYVGAQFPATVLTSPPTTELLWLKDNNVNLAVGLMINTVLQPTITEAERLGMGPGLDYDITFGFGDPAHLQIFVPDMGTAGSGLVVAGDFCALDADVDGVAFANLLQDTYRPDDRNDNVMYLDGIIECMTQVEALRLASMEVDPGELTSADVLQKGFWQIKNLSTGDITITPLTYGQGDTQGVDKCRLQQVQDGKIVELGAYALKNIVPTQKR